MPADLGSAVSPSDALLILAGLMLVLALAVFIDRAKRAPWRRQLARLGRCHRGKEL